MVALSAPSAKILILRSENVFICCGLFKQTFGGCVKSGPGFIGFVSGGAHLPAATRLLAGHNGTDANTGNYRDPCRRTRHPHEIAPRQGAAPGRRKGAGATCSRYGAGTGAAGAHLRGGRPSGGRSTANRVRGGGPV